MKLKKEISINKTIFTVTLFILFLTGCRKNFKAVDNDAILKENHGVLLFTIANNRAPFLTDVTIFLHGYDIAGKNKKEVSKIQIFIKYPITRTYMYIVPAGRYRINEIVSKSRDPRVSPTIREILSLEYKPMFSFYVAKGKVNDLGTISFKMSDKSHSDDKNILIFFDSEANEKLYYKFLQIKNMNNYVEFKKEYTKLIKQTSGYFFQNIIFKPWLRQYQNEDPLKKSPQFENGYSKAKWKKSFLELKSLYENLYDESKLEIVNQYKFIDHTPKKETVVYDFNSIEGIQYPEKGLYKITIYRNADYKKTLRKFKVFYGNFTQENDVKIWRLINNRVSLEKMKENKIRITIVSTEFIRKLLKANKLNDSILEPSNI